MKTKAKKEQASYVLLVKLERSHCALPALTVLLETDMVSGA